MKSNNPSSYGEDKTFPDRVECARPHVGFFSSGGRVLPVGGAEKVTGEYSSLEVGVVQTSITNYLCLPRTSLRTETSIVDLVFLLPRGEPLF